MVEEVTLRTTRLRDINGTVWHVPNGQIQRVGNRSQQWARAVLDVAVAPKNNAALCEAVILTAAKEVWADDQWANEVLEEPEVLGVEYLGPDAMAIRVIGKTRPGSQFTMSRVLRARVAAALDEAGIERPEALWTRAGTPPPGDPSFGHGLRHDAPGAPAPLPSITVHTVTTTRTPTTSTPTTHTSHPPTLAGCSCRCSSGSSSASPSSPSSGSAATWLRWRRNNEATARTYAPGPTSAPSQGQCRHPWSQHAPRSDSDAAVITS